MESEAGKCSFAGNDGAEGGFEFFGSKGVALGIEFFDPVIGEFEGLVDECRGDFILGKGERSFVYGSVGGRRFDARFFGV